MNDMRKLMETVKPLFENRENKLLNKLYDIADEVESMVSNAETELYVEPDVEQAHKYFLLGDYDEAANALLDKLSDLRTSDPAPDPGYYGDIVYDMLMKLAAQHGHIDESDQMVYVCVHPKKRNYKCHAGSSYEAAKKAAEHWGLKSTDNIRPLIQ